MGKTETALRKPICEALRKCGGDITPYVGSTMGREGTCDIFLAHKLWHGWIEFKGPNTKIKPTQELYIQELRKRNVKAVVIRIFENNSLMFDEELSVNWLDGWDILEALQNHDCLGSL